jgi:hypothetical protein
MCILFLGSAASLCTIFPASPQPNFASATYISSRLLRLQLLNFSISHRSVTVCIKYALRGARFREFISLARQNPILGGTISAPAKRRKCVRRMYMCLREFAPRVCTICSRRTAHPQRKISAPLLGSNFSYRGNFARHARR